MATDTELQQLAEQGKQEFAKKSYLAAAQTFERAAIGYARLNDPLSEAEMNNNRSVALLKAGKAQQALEAALGTENVFERGSDRKRQAMALGNQAAALEELKRLDEALAHYERSAELFAEVGEGDLRSSVLKSASAIKLKRGQVVDSGIKMIGALESKEHPSLLDRILKFILRMGK